jgi:hypothetical protein
MLAPFADRSARRQGDEQAVGEPAMEQRDRLARGLLLAVLGAERPAEISEGDTLAEQA